jgi:hypothetical protein
MKSDTSDEYRACATVRNWCAWISNHGQIEDTVVASLFVLVDLLARWLEAERLRAA